MTLLEDPPALDEPVEEAVSASPTTKVEGPVDDRPTVAALLRPVLAAGLASLAAGLMMAGIFGSWPARLVVLVAAAFGPGWALLTQRSRTPAFLHLALAPAVLLVSVILLAVLGGTPAELPTEISGALESGRAFRPPVPFDPGWGPLLFFAVTALGFGSAWVGTALRKPMMAVALPLPIVALTAISQPEGGGLLTGIVAFVPVLAGLAVLFGGDTARAGTLGGDFELKRALRGAVGIIPLVLALVLVNQASFLFPEPVYDPTDKPQKPKAVPLSAALDRVLFEVATTDEVLTGPWRTGVLDVYDGEAWRLPPYDTERFVPLPAGGVLTPIRATEPQTAVTITVRDLGDSAIFPMLDTSTSIALTGVDVVFDPRTGLVRVPSGRVPQNVAYTLQFPGYPDAEALKAVTSTVDPLAFKELLAIPKAPASIETMLRSAPQGTWERLDHLRQRLLKNVTAEGAGAPVDITPERVVDLLEGSKKGSPFEIVAAEAMLARWAGVPSRIGFGFDGLNVETGLLTVRPRNSAQWLEVWFEGYGWIPLIGQPEKAQAELDSDPNTRFDQQIQPSDDVAVELYVLYETDDLRLLYERIRSQLFQVLPFVIALVGAYVGWPAAAKVIRRNRRRRWAAGIGPQAQVAVEYAELRDLAIDLAIGDDLDLPLEWLYKVQWDEEHAELAWLAARVLYGDMRDAVAATDVDAAEKLAQSVRRRLGQAQPMQTRVLAAISRQSLRQPYSPLLPNVSELRLPRPRLPRVRLPRPRLRLPARLPRLPRLAGGRR